MFHVVLSLEFEGSLTFDIPRQSPQKHFPFDQKIVFFPQTKHYCGQSFAEDGKEKMMKKKKAISESMLCEEKPTKFDRIRRALLEYKAVYGDLLVPARYVIPTNDTRYSDDSKGMKLGSGIYHIRMQNTYKEHKEELLVMGFDYDSQVREFEEVKVALLAYKEIYGDLLVPTEYIVPTNDTSYSEEVRGMRLGCIATHGI